NATNIYWANTGNGTISEANLDGSDPTTLITGVSTPSGLVVDANYIYWANQTGNECIGRADLDGSNVTPCFINSSNTGYGPIGLAVNANYIYWTTGYFDTIGRANLNGTSPVQNFIVPAGSPGSDALTGLAVNSSYIYWADETTDTISRANIADGSGIVSPFISGTNSGGVVLDASATYIYWANVGSGTIGRANIDGSGANPSFIGGASSPVGVWVNTDYIYWANSGSSTIGRANLIDVPDAPTIGTATAGPGSGSVSFTFTGNDNGSPIISYTATCTSTGGATGTASGPSSPIVVSGLTNGAPYTCTVTATNSYGTSGPSAPSNMFTPVAVPGAPTIGPGTAAGVGSAVVSFTPPASNGGSLIMSYTATCFSLDGEPTVMASGSGSPITVTGLVAGTPYQCSVTATNAVGTGPPSGLSNMFGLPGAAHCTTVPSAPLALSQAPGNGSAVVSWAPPLTGASCIAGYVVTPYLGTTAQLPVLIPGQGTTTVVSGLTNGLTYTFTVTAENGPAEGPPSTMSGPVLAGAPSAATALHVTKVSNTALKISFRVPANNGAPITKYSATCKSTNGGVAKTTSAKAEPLTVTGLSSGKAYTCTVKASNSRGTGPASRASATIKA
ncbi:MAG: fibronectin type III domain-containing protein, partial [Acidimicrobiia bacterium]